MLDWERRLVVQREMAAARADAGGGAQGTAALRQKLHRLHVRADKAGALQERLSSELERAVAKREVLALKVWAMSL